MEFDELQFDELQLPTSLDKWTNYNLEETYNYCKKNSLKNLIHCELWWRKEKEAFLPLNLL